KPVFRASECKSAVKSAFNRKYRDHVSFRHMAESLDVSPDEAALVSRVTRRSFPAASRFGPQPTVKKPTNRRERTAERRIQIGRILVEQGVVPSLRNMQKMLNSARFAVSD